jgi:hypothetical protein
VERVLSLDISTKTGWSLTRSDQQSIEVECYGTIDQIHMPDGSYPESFVDWANACFSKILSIIDLTAPDVLVIEETSAGSKAIYTQKILEWIHYLVAKLIKETKIKAVYFMTEQWRRETGCLMSKEESKRNKAVREYKKKNKTKIAYDINGKRIGLINRKHVNIRRANEIFGKFLSEPLRKKDEDTADSLMLGYAYHLRKTRKI